MTCTFEHNAQRYTSFLSKFSLKCGSVNSQLAGDLHKIKF